MFPEYLCFCWNQYLFDLLIHALDGAALGFSGALGSGALVAPPPALGSPLAFNNTEVSHDSFICEYAF